jgi:hypothetical protein
MVLGINQDSSHITWRCGGQIVMATSSIPKGNPVALEIVGGKLQSIIPGSKKLLLGAYEHFRSNPVSDGSRHQLIAIGDIHADFPNALRTFYMAGLIDEHQRWVARNTIAVQTGNSEETLGDIPFSHDL